ncbi:hypothetical protein HX082_02745 [Myroides odoratimimus]|uniref:hypothetical protein n=1 Tax=Myroides odoratimimus TaxID=76832 RepID=UPI0025784FB4|nr:hypothetical protein [Myroides odoratimimus]MDM1508312.1 hypothetical protein [Myroides odoratimimus]
MKYNNISTNILRDQDKDLNYIVTQNAVEIFNNIFHKQNSVTKSFTIVGNYGTGKSTFLWAAERNLNKNTFYFTPTLENDNGYDFFKIVGESTSICQSIATSLNIEESDHKSIMKSLESLRLKSSKKGKDLVVVIDEFGKFLEQINKTGNADDLYLIQLIAEWANDERKNVFFIITLHQNFSEYSNNLSQLEKREWEKVKGRFKELVFNEPIEQLLFFASEALKSITISKDNSLKAKELNRFIKTTNLFKYKDQTIDQLLDSIYPLDYLSINTLVNSLQRYGQNERSLFSFLSDLDTKNLEESTTFYTVDVVFDYLIKNLATEIHSYKNPHRVQWQIAFRALDRAELIFEDKLDFEIASKCIKAICLLNLFAVTNSSLNKETLIQYFSITNDSYSNSSIELCLEALYKAGVIRFFNHSGKLNFLEGTDLDIEQELSNISKEVNPNFKIEQEIISNISFPVLSAKRYSFIHGSNRYFEFRVLNNLNEISAAQGAIDGYINLIFDEKIAQTHIKETSENTGANLFVHYHNTKKIYENLFNLKKLEAIKVKKKEDLVAKRIIDQEIQYYTNQLENLVLNDLFETQNTNQWFFNGQQISIKDKKALNKQLSDICTEVFSKEPILKNELINREFISSQISTARKRLIKALLNNSTEKDLGFEENKFPPEKAIYLSLFKDTNIHRLDSDLGYYQYYAPQEIQGNDATNKKFTTLWQECESFLTSATNSRRNLAELYDVLSEAPYKLKKGVRDIWIPAFLIIKKEDYALFHEQSGFIPYIDEEILELVHKNPSKFSIKHYKIEGLKLNLLESYKDLIQVNNNDNLGAKSSFLTVFASFLRFYNSLNEFSKKTKNISNKAIAFRESIDNAKDPEDALFNLFPQALGFTSIDFEKDEEKLEAYIFHIQDAIKQLRGAYDELLNRIETKLKLSFSCEEEFPAYRDVILNRLKGVKVELLEKQSAIFYRRLTSGITERDSWLKSVADVALNKDISRMIDNEESILLSNLEKYSSNILSVVDLHQFEEENKEMVSINIMYKSSIPLGETIIVDKNLSDKLNPTKQEVTNLISNLQKQEKMQLLYELLENELN